jgi:Zinc knuckle
VILNIQSTNKLGNYGFGASPSCLKMLGQNSGTPSGSSSYNGPTPMELRAIQKGPVKCYFCGKQGHIKKNCFKFIKK